MKKIKINENCIGCGACTAIAKEYFEINDDGYAKAKIEKVEEKDIEEVEEAVEGCPTSAIELEEA